MTNSLTLAAPQPRLYTDGMIALPAELRELPLEEKLQLLDLLWSDIRAARGYQPPEWHGEVLAGRLEAYRSGKSKPLNLEKLAQAWRTHRQT